MTDTLATTGISTAAAAPGDADVRASVQGALRGIA
jgi:hypothetical protein